MYRLGRLVLILFILLFPLGVTELSTLLGNNPPDIIILKWLSGLLQFIIVLAVGFVTYYLSYLVINIFRWVLGFDTVSPKGFFDIIESIVKWIGKFISKREIQNPPIQHRYQVRPMNHQNPQFRPHGDNFDPWIPESTNHWDEDVDDDDWPP